MTKEISLTQQSAHKSAPKWTFSTRVPLRDTGKGMPGPGSYGQTHTEKDKFLCTPKYSIAGGQRDTKEWAALPGPGAYTPGHSGKTLPKWAFSSESRLQEVKRSRTPGPGTYDTRGNLEGLSFGIASRPTGSKRSTTPGPGQYKPDTAYGQIFERSLTASFGSSSRSELAMSKTPGPGQYDALGILGGSCAIRSPPRYTIAGKRPTPAVDQTPGPGSGVTQFVR